LGNFHLDWLNLFQRKLEKVKFEVILLVDCWRFAEVFRGFSGHFFVLINIKVGVLSHEIIVFLKAALFPITISDPGFGNIRGINDVSASWIRRNTLP